VGRYYCKKCYDREGRRFYLNGKTCPNCNRVVTILPQSNLAHLQKHSISRFKNDFRLSIGRVGGIGRLSNSFQDNWKPNVFKRSGRTNKVPTMIIKPKKQLFADIFDEKKEYKLIVEGTKECSLQDNTLTIGNDERKQEITIPKNVKLNTIKKKETNNLLVIAFKKKGKKKVKCVNDKK